MSALTPSSKELAIVTGASSGIGEEIVKLLRSEKDLEIWLVARREAKLHQIVEELGGDESVSMKVKCLDLTDSESWEKIESDVKASGQRVRWLVNNAGYGFNGQFKNEDPSHMEGMIQLNVTALTSVTRRLLPFMGRGSAVVNIASSIAFIPAPYFSVYAGTKAFVLSFSLSLREELLSQGINVTAVCPGPVATEFFDTASMDAPPSWIVEKASSTAFLSVEKSTQNVPIIVTGVAAWGLRIISALLPRSVVAKLVGSTYKGS